ncbi:MAG TPA: hypothetical protein VHM65_11220 [Candidatus Lustribacter sp.]|nr:hypothetical protein [Candidatus Lustribacter sp.]
MTRVLALADWQFRARAHEARVDAATQAHLGRRGAGRTHPVEDFLWTYYSLRPGQLRRWHPGPGVRLAEAAGMPRAGWRFYRAVTGGVEVDVDAFVAARRQTLEWVLALLRATQGRSPQLACFGLHEWAMVYRQQPGALRHTGWSLRLGSRATDAVVESHQVRCTHDGAFRFFTPQARALNIVQPHRDSQIELEQPGCLHANMDLYRWAYRLAPAIPSELVMACLELARSAREIDMRSAPYDLRDLGYEPIRIETPDGKTEYVTAQRRIADRAQGLRSQLIDACCAVLAQ